MIRSASFAALATLALTGWAFSAELIDGSIRVMEVPTGSYMASEVKSWPSGANGVTVLIEGPKEYSAMIEFGKSVPGFDLKKYGDVADGLYSYEIRGGTGEKVKKPEALNNGREGKDVGYDFVSFVLSGNFLVDGGVIVDFKQDPEVGSAKPTVGETKPDSDSGKPGISGDGEPGKGDGKGTDVDKG